MNILMLSDVYFPRVNGVSSSIRTFARVLTGMGHRVTLVAPDYSPDGVAAASEQADFDDEGFEVLRLPARKIFFDPEDRLIKASAVRAVLPDLLGQHWDAIHVHTPFRAHTLGVHLRRATSAPVIESYHTYFEEYIGNYLPWLPRFILRAFARRVSRKLCDEVDHLVVPTREMNSVLQSYGVRTPSTVLPTGLDLQEFAGGDGLRFREQHGITPTQPVLVTVSRLALEKNIDFLLQVVRRLIGEFPDLLFVIAGEGPDAPRLKRAAQSLGLGSHTRFFGNLDRRGNLLDCYRAGDLFVFASPTETQGLVLIEAMALGVPIVSTAVMGTATVLAGAHSAQISEETVDAFADHVADLLRDPQRRAAMAAAGASDARAWSVDVLMDRAIEVYRDAVRREIYSGQAAIDAG